MKRRKFLQTAALASVVAVTKPTTAFSTSTQPESLLPEFELEEMTITQLQAAMTSGKFSSKSLVNKYLSYINDIDRDGPKLNSVIELNPEASAIAERCDDERKAGRLRGPLHGIPLLIKDNIDTADRMTTTAGSLALLGSHRTRDSFVAQKLRETRTFWIAIHVVPALDQASHRQRISARLQSELKLTGQLFVLLLPIPWSGSSRPLD